MAEDKYKTPKDIQEIYDRDRNIHEAGDKLVEEAGELEGQEKVDKLSEAAAKKKKDLENRLVQATGFEVGAGIAIDAVTTPLAALPPVYAGVNFIAGGAINTLAQLWRQDDNFSWGEVAASGAVGVVPGLGGKATIAKGVVKGAGTGLAHEAIRIGIDEQRIPTAEEAVVGGTIGGVVGGGVTGVIKGTGELKDRLINYINVNQGNPRLYPLTNRLWSAQGTVGAMKTPTGDDVNPIRQPEIPDNVATQMMRSGLKGGKFDLETWKANSSYRKTMEVIQTDPQKEVKISGKNSLRTQLMPDFLKEFGPYLEKVKQKPGSIELHHIFGLNLSAPLYEGLTFGSNEHKALNAILKKYDIIPGNTERNLILALQEPHDLLHQQFFKKEIGYFGEKFFNDVRLAKIRSGEAGRLEVAEEYAKIINDGETLIRRATDQIQNLFGVTDIPPERLADAFSESLNDGTTNIFKDGYRIESVSKAVKDLVLDIQLDEIVNPLKVDLDPVKEAVLRDRLKGLSMKELEFKYGKNLDYIQNELPLIIEQIPKNKLQQLQLIRRTGSQGTVPPVDSPFDYGRD